MKSVKVPFLLFAVFTFLSLPKVFSYSLYTDADDSVITIDSIKNELSSDGEWIKVNPDEIDSASVTDSSKDFDDNINTDYVWRPNDVDKDWSPYTNGYWTYTDCGWMWNSYYSWGWRPFHYGRWWWSPVWGWVWSPGYVWAPSWVVWMYWDDYCGWYPLSPRVRWNFWYHGYWCGHVRFRVHHWTFVDKHNFLKVINDEGMVPREKNSQILKQAKFASNIDMTNKKVINKGPNVSDIEKATGRKITQQNVSRFNNTKVLKDYNKQVSTKRITDDKNNVKITKIGSNSNTKYGSVTNKDGSRNKSSNSIKNSNGRNNKSGSSFGKHTGNNGRKWKSENKGNRNGDGNSKSSGRERRSRM